MLQFPSDWVQQFGANLITAYPEAGGGRFRYYERLRPQPSFSAIVNRMLASDPDFKVHQVGEMLRIVTAEGEYGAWVKIEGWREGTRARRYIGAVFMDEFATALDCIVIVPAKFQDFERYSLDLIHSETFKMARRTRPFFYVPPLGWQGLPSGLVANFYPLDFPRNLTNIVVQPATLLETDEGPAIEASFSQVGAGLTVESSERDHLTSASGIKGDYLRLKGRRAGRQEIIYREMAMFVVLPYAYHMRLETATAERLLEVREVFRCVAGSFRPLPASDESRLGRAFVRLSTFLDHWAS